MRLPIAAMKAEPTYGLWWAPRELRRQLIVALAWLARAREEPLRALMHSAPCVSHSPDTFLARVGKDKQRRGGLRSIGCDCCGQRARGL